MGIPTHKMIAILLLLTPAIQSELDLVWAPGSRMNDSLIWEPNPPPGYYVIGQYVSRYAEARYLNERISNPDTRIPVARVTNDTDELAVPLDFEMMIDYHNKMNFWKMSCPGNYVALSGIATMKDSNGSEQKPDVNRYRCVTRRIARPQEIFFFFHGNGRYGIWAMPVTGDPIGSFYALAQPREDSSSTIGYQLVATPSIYIAPTVNDATYAVEETTSSPDTTLETVTTDIASTVVNKLTEASDTQLIFEPTSKTHTIIIVVSGTVIGISLVIVCFAICTKLRSKKSKSVLIRPLNNSVSTEISGFVYQNATRSPSGSISFLNNPQKPAREMRINMLYEETTPKEMLNNALHSEVYPKTVQNPLYVSTKHIDEVNET